ncbi:hypothetical protein BMS3Bbin03_01521 [bacterium BMS3Bbin03]|nr:hypothetical protein BMS3Bbin03_01521 [bacterium BMS3Bbin03]
MTQIAILATLTKLYPDAGIFNTDRVKNFYRAIGTDKIRKKIEAGWTVDRILSAGKPELLQFLQLRKNFCCTKGHHKNRVAKNFLYP